MKLCVHCARASFPAAAAVLVLLAAFGCKDSPGHAGTGLHSTNLVILTEANFQAEVLSSSQPVLVDFWATWCPPCKVIAPTVAELASDFQGRAKVAKLDVDTAPALSQKYGIQAIPTLLFFKDGKVVDQSVGVVSKRELQGKLERLLPVTGPKGP